MRRSILVVFSLLYLTVLTVAQDINLLHRELEQIEAELAELPKLIPSAQNHERIGFHGHAADPAWVQIDFGREVTPERIAIFPVRLPVSKNPEANGFPSALEVEISPTRDFASGVRIVHWKESEPGAGLRLPFLNFSGNGASGRFLRVNITGFRQDPYLLDNQFFRLGEIVVLENGQNMARHPPRLRLPVSSRSTDNPRRWEVHNLTDGYLWCLPLRGRQGSPSNGFHSAIGNQEFVDGKSWVEIDLGETQMIDEIHLVPAHPRDFPDAAGFGFPPRFWLLADADTPDEKELLRETYPPYPAEALPNPGAAPLIIATPDLAARTIRLKCETLWRLGPVYEEGVQMKTEFLFALSELQVWRGGENLSLGKAVRHSGATTTGLWCAEALVDGYSSREKLLDWETWLSQIEQAYLLQTRATVIRAELKLLHERSQEIWKIIAIVALVVTPALVAIALLVFRVRAVRANEVLRADIARDLHDEIGAGLSHLAIQSHLASQQLPEDSEHRPRLHAISKSARETFDNMRDIVWMLSPSSESWKELAQRMELIANRLLAEISHEVSQHGEPPSGDPPVNWARCVVSILKEALTNAYRHSGADKIHVNMYWANQEFKLCVKDDGCGFDVDSVSTTKGLGLGNLRHRAQAFAMKLEILSEQGEGTLVTLLAPISKTKSGKVAENRHKPER